MTDAVLVNLKRGAATNTLSFHIGGQCVLELEYRKPVIDPPLEHDPTPFVEEEHFDFGLFVRNVVSDRTRRERIYR